jgi:hypothetical protein
MVVCTSNFRHLGVIGRKVTVRGWFWANEGGPTLKITKAEKGLGPEFKSQYWGKNTEQKRPKVGDGAWRSRPHRWGAAVTAGAAWRSENHTAHPKAGSGAVLASVTAAVGAGAEMRPTLRMLNLDLTVTCHSEMTLQLGGRGQDRKSGQGGDHMLPACCWSVPSMAEFSASFTRSVRQH